MRIGPVTLAWLALSLVPVALQAQTSPALTHLGHVTSGFGGAPDGKGLAVTAANEISQVMRHANLAALHSDDLEAMRSHAGHVLHLIDPQEGTEGPGLGFGTRRGVEAIVQHLGMAAAADGASAELRTHAEHVEQAGAAVMQRADAVADLARQLQAATSATDAAQIAESMRVLALQLDTGFDADESGRIDLVDEAGFVQMEDHTYLILEAERLPRILQ